MKDVFPNPNAGKTWFPFRVNIMNFLEYDVEIVKDGVYIFEKGNRDNEIVCWVMDEWKEDPEIVPSIINAVYLAINNPKEFERRLGAMF